MNPTTIFTARKRSLRRLYFYTCLSVILFTEGGGCLVGGVPGPGGLLRRVPDWGVPAPGGLLLGVCSWGGGWCLLGGGGVCSRRKWVGGAYSGGCLVETPPPPPRDGYCCWRYASYWNAFLFLKVLVSTDDLSVSFLISDIKEKLVCNNIGMIIQVLNVPNESNVIILMLICS